MTLSMLRKTVIQNGDMILSVGTPGHCAGEQYVRDSLSLHLSSGGTHMICILQHSLNLKNACMSIP